MIDEKLYALNGSANNLVIAVAVLHIHGVSRTVYSLNIVRTVLTYYKNRIVFCIRGKILFRTDRCTER